MPQDHGSEQFASVCKEERQAINGRRQAVNLPPVPTVADEKATQAPVRVAGLALSGGGIRSGAFNLGLLQSLHERGVLRQADYLSSVSGGSYVGAYLHTWCGETGAAAAPTHEETHRLILGGLYLKRPFLFLSHWLFGILVNVAVVLFGLLSLASFLAWLYRWLDQEDAMLYLMSLGFQSDVKRAFVPALVLFFIWFAAWMGLALYHRLRGTQGRGWSEKLLGGLAVMAAAAALMGLAALLNTGDISLGPAEWWSEDVKDRVNSLAGHFKVALMFILFAVLLPYLRPQDLIRSGTQPRTPVHGWIFQIASYGFLVGLPLVLFGFMARENISDYNATRKDRHLLKRTFTGDWEKFLNTVQQGAAAGMPDGNAPAYKPHQAVLEAMTSPIAGEEETQQQRDDPDLFLRLEQRRKDFDKDTWFWERWASWAWPGGVTWKLHYRDLRNRKELQDKLCERINVHCLRSPSFHEAFAGIDSDKSKAPGMSEADARRWRELRTSAKALQEQGKGAMGEVLDIESPLTALNAEMFRLYYGSLVRDPTKVFATVVLPADQERRLVLCLVFLILFGVLALFFSLNRSSMHSFYRDRLADLWLHGRQDLSVAGLSASVARGNPYPLMNATANLQAAEWKVEQQKEPLAVFTFSPHYCGSERTGYLPTGQYEGGEYRVADAIAVSGAAVGPAVMRGPTLMLLLFLFNSRTGQWLWNPRRPPGLRSRILFPAPLGQLVGYLCFQPQNRFFHFISDGGHLENLGVESLLRRRCRLIIASDATCDPGYGFQDLMKLFRRMRLLYDIHFRKPGTADAPLALRQLTPEAPGQLARRHFLVAEIDYGGGHTGYFIYVKPTFTGDEPPELLHYRQDNDKFPHDPTLDQFFDPRRFECYRQLGEHIGRGLADYLESAARPAKETWLADWTPAGRPAAREASADDGAPDLTEQTVPRFVDLLSDSDGFRRRTAARLIADGGHRLPVPAQESLLAAVVQRLDTPEPWSSVRAALVASLGRFSPDAPKNRERLHRIMADPAQPPKVRRAAAEALWNLGYPAEYVL